MKKTIYSTLIFLLLLGISLSISSSPLLGSDKKEKEELDKKYKTFLQDVEYIITKAEREAFYKMPSNEMRDLFIKNFWEVRDPTPGTPRNEFKEEHYRRLEYANKYLGRETYRPGWQTDRGRTYILLGEPRDIQRYPDSGRTYPLELWFYDAGGLPTLPPYFYLIFFKRYGSGEYELYSPMQDGPQALLTGYFNDPTNYQEPYKELQQVSMELARASLSLDPSDPLDYYNMRPSLGSEMLLAKINDLPNHLVSPGYVKNMLDGIPTVTVKYTYNLLDLGSFAGVYKNNAGDYFLHYAIQIDAQHLNVGKYEDKIYSTFEVSGEMKTAENVSIGKIKDTFDIEIKEEDFEKSKYSPFVLEGKTSIIPGEYTLTLMVVNKVSKEYGSIEKKIVIPEKVDELKINTPVLVSKKIDTTRDTPFAKVNPFTFENTTLIPNVKGEFPLGSYMLLYFQIYLPESRENINSNLLEAKYTITSQDKVVWEDSDSLAKFLQGDANTLSLLKPIKLDFGLGDFKLKIFLAEGEPVKLSADPIEFKVLNPQELPFPLVFAKKYDPDTSYTYNLQKAVAQLALGNRPKAIEELRLAHNKKPDFQEATKSLARMLLESKRYQEVIDLLKAEIIKHPNDFEYLIYLGISNSQLANYYDAIRFYERARLVEQPTAELLNALGEAYLKSENKEKAKEVFSQSLKINPDQPKLKELLKELGS
jgi:GWxTD domain-containing protein